MELLHVLQRCWSDGDGAQIADFPDIRSLSARPFMLKACSRTSFAALSTIQHQRRTESQQAPDIDESRIAYTCIKTPESVVSTASHVQHVTMSADAFQ